jgi:hypothetical protein
VSDSHGTATLAPATAPAILGTPKPHVHWGLLVEFQDQDALLAAAAKVRDAGFARWDCHTPFPVHGLDKAMAIKPTILPWIALGGALTGFCAGIFLQHYANGIVLPFSLYQNDHFVLSEVLAPFLPSGYDVVTSGKPIFSTPAFIPIIFELTVLLGAFGAFFGQFALSMLPQYYHPVFQSERFKRATDDRFFISIEAADPVYDRKKSRELADSLGGHVEELEA